MVSPSEINKKVILAKAGSGKTTYITTDDAFNFKRIIYITYTNNNVANIKEHLSKNRNISTDHVLVCTYHTFLIKNFFQPFIREFQQYFESKFFLNSGLNWVEESVISRHKRFAKKENVTYWCDKQGRIYGNRLSSLIIEGKFASQFQESLQRLGKFCDLIVVDEFQDFTSADAKFLKRLMTEFEKEVIFVGDLFQACVATTAPRQSPYKDVRILDEEAFVRKRLNLPKTKVKVDLDSFVKSHRISTKVANFVSTNLGIKISSDGQHTGQVQYLDVENIDSLLEQTSKILVYKSVEKIPLKFRDKALTWKLSKGLTFDDTTVILTKSALDILTNDKKLKEASNAQINSLYVALTRSLSNVFLITPNVWDNYKKKI